MAALVRVPLGAEADMGGAAAERGKRPDAVPPQTA